MKTTLTKTDPVGWYLENDSGDFMPLHWDGYELRPYLTKGGSGFNAEFKDGATYTLLFEAPAEYFTAKQRAEQFFTEFAAHPVCDMQAIFERHLLSHVASLVLQNKLLAAALDDAKHEVRDQKAAALFHRTQMEETLNVARGHGWQPGSSLANWLKEKLTKVAVPVVTDIRNDGDKLQYRIATVYCDQHIGTQDTSNMPGIGDGDDTWEAPDLDDRYEPSPETLVSGGEILDAKCVPDSPGEWHNLKTKHVWRVYLNAGSGTLLAYRIEQSRNVRVEKGTQSSVIELSSNSCDWVKAVPPTDPCEAVKTLRRLARDVHEACDRASIPTHGPKMAAQHLPEPLSVRDRLQLSVTWCHDTSRTIQAKDGMARRLNAEVNELRTQLVAAFSERTKFQGILSAIGRLVQPLAGETLTNAVVRKLDLLNQLLEAIKAEGDPVGTVKALRAQRDSLRTEVQHLKDEIAGGGVVEQMGENKVAQFRNAFYAYMDQNRPWSRCGQWPTNVFPTMIVLADKAAELFSDQFNAAKPSPKPKGILVEFANGRRDWVTHIQHCDYKVVRTGENVRRSQFTVVPQAAA